MKWEPGWGRRRSQDGRQPAKMRAPIMQGQPASLGGRGLAPSPTSGGTSRHTAESPIPNHAAVRSVDNMVSGHARYWGKTQNHTQTHQNSNQAFTPKPIYLSLFCTQATTSIQRCAKRPPHPPSPLGPILTSTSPSPALACRIPVLAPVSSVLNPDLSYQII